MKRIIAMLLSLVLLMGLCACGEPKAEEPTAPAEVVAACEAYARTAAGVGKYASGETLTRAVVWSGDGVAATICPTPGKASPTMCSVLTPICTTALPTDITA